MLIDIAKIEVGERLRSRLDPLKLRQLADDMERNGQLQEIVVAIKWGINSRGATIVERATLVAGYRRLEAAKLLGWTQIRCTRQLGGDIDPDSAVDLLRAEFSENEMREDFTEMERVAFGVKIKERIAAAARERMLAGKKPEYEYDPETGYKVWNEDDEQDVADTAIVHDGDNTADPTLNSAEGTDETLRYGGGEVNVFVAQKIGMGKDKFRQGEYVLKHGTEEQRTAIDRGRASISGVYTGLKPKPPKPAPTSRREQLTAPTDTEPATSESRPKTSGEPAAFTLASRSRAAKKDPFFLKLKAEEADAVRKRREYDALPPEGKIAELERQLREARARAAGAEFELAREKELRYNDNYHRDGTIENLKGRLKTLGAALAAAEARIQELEEKA